MYACKHIHGEVKSAVSFSRLWTVKLNRNLISLPLATCKRTSPYDCSKVLLSWSLKVPFLNTDANSLLTNDCSFWFCFSSSGFNCRAADAYELPQVEPLEFEETEMKYLDQIERAHLYASSLLLKLMTHEKDLKEHLRYVWTGDPLFRFEMKSHYVA